MRIFFYVLTAIGSLIGGFFLFLAFATAESAPQEASLAAIAVAFAVLPYCFARAVERIGDANMASDLNLIAQHYRRIEQEAHQQRIEEIKNVTNQGDLPPTRSQLYAQRKTEGGAG